MYEGMDAKDIANYMATHGYTQEGVDRIYQIRGIPNPPRLPPSMVGVRQLPSRGARLFQDANGRQIRGTAEMANFLNTYSSQVLDPFRELDVGNYLGIAGMIAGGAGALGPAGTGAWGTPATTAAGTAAGTTGTTVGTLAGSGAHATVGGLTTSSGLGYFGGGGTAGLAGLGGGNAGALAASGAIGGGAGSGASLGGLFGGGGSAAGGASSMGWLDTLLDIAPDVLGAVLGHDAAGDASRLQQQGAREAIAETRRQYDQNREDLRPYREAGTTALGQIGTGLEDGGDFNRDFTINDFEKDPGYEFRRDEGRRALEGSAAASGGLFSGGTGRRLERYGQDYASGEFSNAYNRFNNDRTTRFNRLASIAGVGQTATNTGVNAGIQSSRDVSDSIIGGANAAAAGRVGEANALTGGVESLGNYYRNRRYGGTIGSSGWI